MRERPWLLLRVLPVACIVTAGCTMGLHGSFIPHSFPGPADGDSAELIGGVEGRSCQTRVLYAFGAGEPATTDAAVADAKGQHPDTAFLADISIDDEVEWRLGYSRQCIVVRAQAYR